MRNYEAVVIFNSEAEQLNNAKEFLKNEFQTRGMNVLKEEDMGDKILAYEIKNQNKGHYYLYEFESDPQNIKPIQDAIKLKTEIIKYLFIHKD